MKRALFCCLLSSLFFYGCEEENEILNIPGGLNWENSYIGVLNGASSVKIQLMLTQPGTLYYVVSTSPIENQDNAFIKSQALEGNITDIVKSGSIPVSSAEVGDTTEIILEGLQPELSYYTYTVAEAEESDDETREDIAKPFANQLYPRQSENSFESAVMGKEMLYLAYALEDYYLEPESKYPLLIFLHGMGEYASEGEINLYRNTTIPQLIHNGNDYPFIVISPQLNTGSWSADFVDEVISHAIKKYRVDESRIYMTGISLGGIGTWNYALNYPERLAAVVPISGSGNSSIACNMNSVPVWAFHNSSDGLVNTSGSVNMINALKECNPACPVAPQLTLYPDAGHNAWVRTYDGSAGHDIFSWLLTFKK